MVMRGCRALLGEPEDTKMILARLKLPEADGERAVNKTVVGGPDGGVEEEEDGTATWFASSGISISLLPLAGICASGDDEEEEAEDDISSGASSSGKSTLLLALAVKLALLQIKVWPAGFVVGYQMCADGETAETIPRSSSTIVPTLLPLSRSSIKPATLG
ncbi:hypothetical protein Taro_056204 [Colocasia esculenta]|uniref:Uncharacterized protein n=1 Tax=Colocasia esculenta TaxID=4460 RepID=A0A843XVT4_COLES|nr:hypothetical protein [Colocasia esculenta]